MKTLFRVLVLLAAALVVVAAVSAFVQSDYADILPTSPVDHSEASQEVVSSPGSTPQSDGSETGEEGGAATGPSLLGLGQVVKNLVITGLVITLVTGGGGLLQRLRLAGRQPARAAR